MVVDKGVFYTFIKKNISLNSYSLVFNNNLNIRLRPFYHKNIKNIKVNIEEGIYKVYCNGSGKILLKNKQNARMYFYIDYYYLTERGFYNGYYKKYYN